FGRETEIARIGELLEWGDEDWGLDVGHRAADSDSRVPTERVIPALNARLVTLTGPGGCGKTRLALEAAGRLRERWRDSVWFVSLADLSEPHVIADAVRDALHLPRTPRAEALEQVVSFLSNQPSLLL